MTEPNRTPDAWLTDILDRFQATILSGAGQGLDQDAHHEQWVDYLEREAVEQAREHHQLPSDGVPEHAEAEFDEIADDAVALRRAVVGDDRAAVSEAQVFLLFYLATLVHADALTRGTAEGIARIGWKRCAASTDGDEPTGFDVADADADAPWPITVPSPATPESWCEEIKAAYGASPAPAPLVLSDGTYRAKSGLMEAAVVLALTQRGVRVPLHDVRELIDAIIEMEADVNSCGPEWEEMQDMPQLAFTMYYLWVHLAIGALEDNKAERIVAVCTDRLPEFPVVERPKPPGRPPQGRPQRRPPPHHRRG